MKPKEAFIRAIQQVNRPHDETLPFVVRCALNLKAAQVPRNIKRAARRFVRRVG